MEPNQGNLQAWDRDHERIARKKRESKSITTSGNQGCHTLTQPQPSYYGPDFQSVEKKCSSSFSFPLREPEIPDPWKQRPEPWTPEIQAEYDSYKDEGPKHHAIARYNSAARMRDQVGPDLPRIELETEIIGLAQDARTRVNE